MSHFEAPWQRRRRERHELLTYFARYEAQRAALERGDDVEPPWVFYPDSEPWWGGWRQGNGEAWWIQIWEPFWSRLHARRREAYAARWNIPEVWREKFFREPYR